MSIDDTFALGRGGATYRPVAYFSSHQGGMSLTLVNRHDADDLEYIVQAAAGPGMGKQSADWRSVDEVQVGAVSPGEVALVHDVADEEDFRFFRLLVRGEGVPFLVLFTEPTGADETESGEGSPDVELTYDADLDILTATATGGLTFEDIASLGYVTLLDPEGNYMDREVEYNMGPVYPLVFIEPQDPLYSFVVQSPTVITISFAALWWFAFDGDPGALLEMTFCRDLGGVDVKATWTGNLAIQASPAIPATPSYNPETDILTVQIDGDAVIPAGPASVRFYTAEYFESQITLNGTIDEDGLFTATDVRAQLPHQPGEDATITVLEFLDEQGNVRGTWTGSYVMQAPFIEAEVSFVYRTSTDPQYAVRIDGNYLLPVAKLILTLDDAPGTLEVTEFLSQTANSISFDGTALIGNQINDLEMRDAEDVVVYEQTPLNPPVAFPTLTLVESQSGSELRLTGTRLLSLDFVEVIAEAWGWDDDTFAYYRAGGPYDGNPNGLNQARGEGPAGVITSWTDTLIVLTDPDLAGVSITLLTGKIGDVNAIESEDVVVVLGTVQPAQVEVSYEAVSPEVLVETIQPHIEGTQGQIVTFFVSHAGYIGGSFRVTDGFDTTLPISLFDAAGQLQTALRLFASVGPSGVPSSGSTTFDEGLLITIYFDESVGTVDFTTDVAPLYNVDRPNFQIDTRYLNVGDTDHLQLSGPMGTVTVPLADLYVGATDTLVQIALNRLTHLDPAVLGATLTQVEILDVSEGLIGSWTGSLSLGDINQRLYVEYQSLAARLLLATNVQPMWHVTTIEWEGDSMSGTIDVLADLTWAGDNHYRYITAAELALLGVSSFTRLVLKDEDGDVIVEWTGDVDFI